MSLTPWSPCGPCSGSSRTSPLSDPPVGCFVRTDLDDGRLEARSIKRQIERGDGLVEAVRVPGEDDGALRSIEGTHVGRVRVQGGETEGAFRAS